MGYLILLLLSEVHVGKDYARHSGTKVWISEIKSFRGSTNYNIALILHLCSR